MRGPLCLIVGVVMLAAPCLAQDQPAPPSDVLFSCAFDGSVKPEITHNSGEPQPRGELQFMKGFQGQAFVTSHTQGCAWPIKDNLNVSAGTIKLWVMPIDWQVGDGQFHHWFRVVGEQGADKTVRPFDILLYKFFEWDTALAYGMCGELTGSNSIQLPMDHLWAPKRWHQIAFTWDATGASLYMDGEGKRQAFLQGPPNAIVTDVFSVGGPYFRENASHTAIDELAIYNRKLSDQEIEALYREELIQSAMGRYQ